MTVLVLCADDYALTEGVSQGIVSLALAGRVSAVSCMSISPRWEEDAPLLAPILDRCDVGLHFTLTDLEPLAPMPVLGRSGRPVRLQALLRAALFKALDEGEVAAELARQVDAFERALGRPPDFIDGHQHVHLLPGIRDAILRTYQNARLDRNRTYVRNCFEPPAAVLRRRLGAAKAVVLSVLARPLATALQREGIPTNDSFRGVNSFEVERPVRPLFRSFLRGQGERPLVMCHPGLQRYAGDDPIARRRAEEHAYLQSDAFVEDLSAAGVRLGRLVHGDRTRHNRPVRAESPR